MEEGESKVKQVLSTLWSYLYSSLPLNEDFVIQLENDKIIDRDDVGPKLRASARLGRRSCIQDLIYHMYQFFDEPTVEKFCASLDKYGHPTRPLMLKVAAKIREEMGLISQPVHEPAPEDPQKGTSRARADVGDGTSSADVSQHDVYYPVIDDLKILFSNLAGNVLSIIGSLTSKNLQTFSYFLSNYLKPSFPPDAPLPVIPETFQHLKPFLIRRWDPLQIRLLKAVVEHLVSSNIQDATFKVKAELNAYENLLKGKVPEFLSKCRSERVSLQSYPGQSSVSVKIASNPAGISLSRIVKFKDFFIHDLGLPDTMFAGFSEGCIILFFSIPTECVWSLPSCLLPSNLSLLEEWEVLFLSVKGAFTVDIKERRVVHSLDKPCLQPALKSVLQPSGPSNVAGSETQRQARTGDVAALKKSAMTDGVSLLVDRLDERSTPHPRPTHEDEDEDLSTPTSERRGKPRFQPALKLVLQPSGPSKVAGSETQRQARTGDVMAQCSGNPSRYAATKPTERDLKVVADHAGSNWSSLLTNLDIPWATIEKMRSECSTNLWEACTRGLVLWLNGGASDSNEPVTFGTLFAALKDSGMAECVALLVDRLDERCTPHPRPTHEDGDEDLSTPTSKSREEEKDTVLREVATQVQEDDTLLQLKYEEAIAGNRHMQEMVQQLQDQKEELEKEITTLKETLSKDGQSRMLAEILESVKSELPEQILAFGKDSAQLQQDKLHAAELREKDETIARKNKKIGELELAEKNDLNLVLVALRSEIAENKADVLHALKEVGGGGPAELEAKKLISHFQDVPEQLDLIRGLLEEKDTQRQKEYTLLREVATQVQEDDTLLQAKEGKSVKNPAEWIKDSSRGVLKLVPRGSEEYGRIAFCIRESAPDIQVEKVERVQNEWLWEKYYNNRELIKKKNRGVGKELQLFHGTRGTAPEHIYQGEEGFDMRFSQRGMWGTGHYFAKKASYSHNYRYTAKDGSHQMFLATVLIGDSYDCKPDRDLRMPPEKLMKTSQVGFNVERYDSVTGVTKGSQVYIIYDNSKAYPNYLITYK